MARALRVVETLDATEPAVGPQAFEDFFAEHSRRIYGSLCLITRNRAEAEEIAQDAFLAVWERWDRVGTMQDPAGYLYRVAFNTARKRFRRAAAAARLRIRTGPAADPIDAADDRTTVGAALNRLPPRQRMAIVLTELVDLTASEAASIMRVKESTVRALATQARTAMRTRIGDRP